jgi:elongator complex protein 2
MSEDAPTVRSIFTAVGCNREPNVVDWNHSLNFAAYGGGSSVVIYNADPRVNTVIATLRGHTQDVNCVKWLPSPLVPSTEPSEPSMKRAYLGSLLSGGFDGQIILWHLYQHGVSEPTDAADMRPSAACETYIVYEQAAALTPSPPVVARAAAALSDGAQSSIALASGAATTLTAIASDSIIALAVCDLGPRCYVAAVTVAGFLHLFALPVASAGAAYEHVQSLQFPSYQLLQAVAFTACAFAGGARALILAAAGVEGGIMLFALPPAAATDAAAADIAAAAGSSHGLTYLCSLAGHTDWVRSLAFCTVDPGSIAADAEADPDADAAVSSAASSGAATDTLLLASASQDSTVRLWRLAAPTAALTAAEAETGADADADADAGVDTVRARTAARAAGAAIGDDDDGAGSDGDGDDAGAGTGASAAGSSISARRYYLTVAPGLRLTAALEAVLVGHEDWALSAQWHPRLPLGAGRSAQPLALLTASADKSLIVWQPDAALGTRMWLSGLRVGESGGHTLGFYGAVWGPSGRSVLGVGFSGCFHLWVGTQAAAGDSSDPDAAAAATSAGVAAGGVFASASAACAAAASVLAGTWVPAPFTSGHSGAVRDLILAYEPLPDLFPHQQGEQTLEMPTLTTLSADQTTRVFGPWHAQSRDPKLSRHAYAAALTVANPSAHAAADATAVPAAAAATPAGDAGDAADAAATWFEIARPQVHGWDLNALAPVPHVTHAYASCAEEKVIRVFAAPVPFFGTAAALCAARAGVPPPSTAALTALFAAARGRRAWAAQRPELGLSNKGIAEGDEAGGGGGIFANSAPGGLDLSRAPLGMRGGLAQVLYTRPPVEDEALSSTLWPEADKLYGHGNEVMVLAAAHALPLLASAAAARRPRDAGIRLWDTRTWAEVGELLGHQASVTALAFAPRPAPAPVPVGAVCVSTEAPAAAAGTAAAVQEELTAVGELADRWLVSVSRDLTWALWHCDASPVAVAAVAAAACALAPSDCSVARLVAAPAGSDAGSTSDASSGQTSDVIAQRASEAADASAAAHPAPRFTLAATQKAHGRQLLSVCWLPCAGGFVTTSRDKGFKLWRIAAGAEAAAGGVSVVPGEALPPLAGAATALACVASYRAEIPAAAGAAGAAAATVLAPVRVVPVQVLFAGLEDGSLLVLRRDTPSGHQQQQHLGQPEWRVVHTVSPQLQHSAAVTRIAVGPHRTLVRRPGGAACVRLTVATASDDHSVRLATFDL